MSPFFLTPPPLQQVVEALRAWPVEAQQQARRNAMVALTACTERRAEREEVERFLRERAGIRSATPRDAAISLHA